MDTTYCSKGTFSSLSPHSVQPAFLAVSNGKPQLAEADLATTARLTAAQAAKTIQTGTKGAADRFNSFVEDTGTGGSGGVARSRGAVEPERRDFWDSFGDAGAEKNGSSGAIGTAAMRKGGGGGGSGGKEEGWGDW